MITILVAYDQNLLIGNQEKIPWDIAEDLERFRSLTMGHPVILGRKTWDSLPKRPLPGRHNIVITAKSVEIPLGFFLRHDTSLFVARDIREAFKLAEENHSGKEVFVIGGGQIYHQVLKLDLVDRILASVVIGEYEGDAYFPNLERDWDFEIVSEHEEFNVIEFMRRR